MKLYSYDKYYPVVHPTYSDTQLKLYNKKMELLNVERELLKEIERVTRAFRDYQLELYNIKNKEVIVERQVNNPVFDAYA
jgi:hypothetical protein